MAGIIIGCGESKSQKAAREAAEAEAAKAAETARLDSLAQARLDEANKNETKVAELPAEPVFVITTNLGTMKIKLYSKTPKHRDNFAKLAMAGYYDDLLFHRVIKGFMIQGGDPFSRDTARVAQYGQGGPGYTIPAEIIPEYTHKKGAVAAARRGDSANPNRESSGSQFYIVQDEAGCASLNGAYSVFGETIEGLDVIDKIAAVATNNKDLPLNPVKIISIKLDESSKPKGQ
ncbi:MAG: peptidylprolyl isomerase [Bacteroidales bacterium]|nr:peptidylprolyl isomerase [Bacteroidales bacterium]MBQ9172338.1 peptidylprolyl isomerase [Bacteroidales bacterium]MBQ9710774.1 peptidylprolyl isomerase [Bacteroidales bacterium]MBR1435612.1 peptidylprolyl isomerase [Bacteroidales bacterium]